MKYLAEEGADVAVVDINSDTAKKIADDVRTMGRKALPIVADLTDDSLPRYGLGLRRDKLINLTFDDWCENDISITDGCVVTLQIDGTRSEFI